MSEASNHGIQGLNEQQVLLSRQTHGRNATIQQGNAFIAVLKDILTEPMVLLLLVAASLYFISGEIGDAVFMTVAIFIVTGISLFQESKSRNALSALRKLTAPTARVIREGGEVEVDRSELVVGDFMIVEEGSSVPADGKIVQSNDFSVDESILTGESLSVEKSATSQQHQVYQGTVVVAGLAICEVSAVGQHTALGKIGTSVELIDEDDTPLQSQIKNFVKRMALAGVIVFLLVWAINFAASHNLLDSLLKALTLAMSILPEEIPVAFTTFMAIGAWRLMRVGIIAKHTKTVETLGSATVICTDKTGTITENRMALTRLYTLSSDRTMETSTVDDAGKTLIETAMWASEPIPFDPMEIALHEAYGATTASDRRSVYKMVHEYPLGGRPPMMTHVFADDTGQYIVAAKGAPEAIMAVSALDDGDRLKLSNALRDFTSQGFRVLAVSAADYSGGTYPQRQQDWNFRCLGLAAFYDPPKKNIAEVFSSFYKAGIKVKIITGDNAATTATIARQIQFKGAEKTLNGEQLLEMTDDEVQEQVRAVNIFTRMFPDAKLRILNALKANGEVVAMTGDGVNDAPALKAAHIGIAMGRKGTELAKEVSSLIITDDDLARMVSAVAMGRKIYTNLKKAIQYVISIHIPIILIVLVPLLLGWTFPAIFSPVHVIFLELIMGPTCSIIYENEPMEPNTMIQPPAPLTNSFFSWRELSTSIVQGLVITAAALSIYQLALVEGANEDVTRTLVFYTLISANIFLTLVNRSFYYSMLTTLTYRNFLVPLVIVVTVVLGAVLLLFPPAATLFGFEQPSSWLLFLAVATGAVSVIWFEGVKWLRRTRSQRL
jgi:Ca2+-transporting ATPase